MARLLLIEVTIDDQARKVTSRSWAVRDGWVRPNNADPGTPLPDAGLTSLAQELVAGGYDLGL
jgi:hypothetical protein